LDIFYHIGGTTLILTLIFGGLFLLSIISFVISLIVDDEVSAGLDFMLMTIFGIIFSIILSAT